ncbi:MAG: beta-galactosidase [Clostridia bacterium]|nr:beta-galactosidase [Clostridia bacterium]NCC43250.1 beta-galactosidase [Clostridia bacterium]
MDKLLYGVAYYDEYMPYDRLDKDIEMMKAAGINLVRIAESTWSTCEPQEGVFDFSHVTRVLDAMEKAGISVIIGTPTYAIPTWMVKSHPDVLATTKNGRGIYGARQIMDITHPVYRYYGERVIRKLMEVSAHRSCVIGFQLDNETKYYDTAGKNVQEQFVKYVRAKFHDDLDAFNAEFGLDYWSNRINAWEDFPDVRGTINGSLGAEFEKFQRTLVDEYLQWQANIVREYAREDQFITHNFDFDWRGYSYGVQPKVDHFHAAKALSVAGVDIYHPTQDELTGAEISYGGDSTRSLKNDNYFVLETEAQGFPCWVPYDGQLRLQAYSHVASGANMVEYWHWHSIHNSFETYWKGLLSHDFKENDTYRAAKVIGREFAEIGSHLVNLKKKNKAAILVSNESLTALDWFPIDGTAGPGGKVKYNDVVRYIYDCLYKLNVECDFLWPETDRLGDYDFVAVPALYAAPEELLEKINTYVEQGGHLFTTFKTAFTNENLKVYPDNQPHGIDKCLGISYSHFTFPKNVWLTSKYYDCQESEIKNFMELIIPDTAEVLASYDHYNWKRYAAVTRNHYGKGTATYLGCWTEDAMLKEIMEDTLVRAGILSENPEGAAPNPEFPVIVKRGTNDFGKEVVYYFNYSPEVQKVSYSGAAGIELLTKKTVDDGQRMEIGPWDLKIVER